MGSLRTRLRRMIPMSAEPLTDVRYLDVPDSSCARGTNRLAWEETVPVRAGDHVLGVRVNTSNGAHLLRELFSDRLVPDAEPPPNVSVYLAPDASDGRRELHRLYVNGVLLLRSREPARILEAAWHEVDMRDRRASGEDLLADAAVLLRGGEAYLLPSSLRRRLNDRERRWTAHGFVLLDRRWCTIDLAAGTIRRPVLGGLDPDLSGSIDVDGQQELTIGYWTASLDPLSPARRLTVAAQQLLDRPGRLAAGDIEHLRALLERPEPPLSDDPSGETLTSPLRARPRS